MSGLLPGTVVRSSMPCPLCGEVIAFNAIIEADGEHAAVPPDAEINVHLHTAHPNQKVPQDERLPADQRVAPPPAGPQGASEK